MRRRNQKRGIMSDNTQRRGKHRAAFTYLNKIYVLLIRDEITAIVENFMVREYNKSLINRNL